MSPSSDLQAEAEHSWRLQGLQHVRAARNWCLTAKPRKPSKKTRNGTGMVHGTGRGGRSGGGKHHHHHRAFVLVQAEKP